MQRKPMHSGSPRRRPSYRRRWSSATSRTLCCGTGSPSWYGTNCGAGLGRASRQGACTSISAMGGLSCCFWMSGLDIWKRSPFICLFLFPKQNVFSPEHALLWILVSLLEEMFWFNVFMASLSLLSQHRMICWKKWTIFWLQLRWPSCLR